MKIETGYLYHIKEEFFDKINDKELMINHENGHSRPSYLAIKDNKVLWFIPLSTKISKYSKIIDDKIKKYGKNYSYKQDCWKKTSNITSKCISNNY